MLNDLLDALPESLAAVEAAEGSWSCLGLVETRDEAGFLAAALGERYEVMSEPFSQNIAVSGGRSVRRGAHSYEVWARVAR